MRRELEEALEEVSSTDAPGKREVKAGAGKVVDKKESWTRGGTVEVPPFPPGSSLYT